MNSINNTENKYGWIAISLHWLSAFTVFGLFGLGYWMVDLSYYDSWYKTGPDLHRSIGITLFFVLCFRLYWRLTQTKPKSLSTHSKTEKLIGHLTHQVLYLTLFAIMIAGYLISTADGRSITVFNLFEVPGFGSFIEDQEDIAGAIHKWLAYFVVLLAVMHALAALKHHFFDRDETLLRMLGRSNENRKVSK